MVKVKFYRVRHYAILFFLFVGSYFFFNHIKKQSDLDDYYREKLERCHYTIIHPCRKMITSSMRDTAAEDWEKIQEQMLQDGYTRAEVKKMDDKTFWKTQKEFKSFDDQFWEDLEDRVVGSK